MTHSFEDVLFIFKRFQLKLVHIAPLRIAEKVKVIARCFLLSISRDMQKEQVRILKREDSLKQDVIFSVVEKQAHMCQ